MQTKIPTPISFCPTQFMLLQKSLQPISDMKVFETTMISNYQDNSINRKIPLHKALIE